MTRISQSFGLGPGAGAERSFSPPGALGAQRKPDHAVAEDEPRGAAGRLGSVKASARGREQTRNRVSTLREPWVCYATLTTPSQSMNLAARRADSDQSKLRSGDGSRRGAKFLPSGSLGCITQP